MVWSEHGNNENAAIAFCKDDLVDRGGRFVSEVGDLDWRALNSGRSKARVAEADTPIGDGCNHCLAHAIGRMQAKLLALIVEHVNCGTGGTVVALDPSDTGADRDPEIDILRLVQALPGGRDRSSGRRQAESASDLEQDP